MNQRKTQLPRHSTRILAMGSLFLSILFILFGLLLFIAGPLQQRQELRQQAMTPSGTAQLEFAPSPGSSIPATTQSSFDIKLVPYTVMPLRVEFVFDLITHETIDVSEVVLNPETGIRADNIEFKKVDHGYTVIFKGQYPEGGVHSGDGSSALTIVTVKFQPKKAGKLQVSFDKERSKLIALNNDQQVDELRTVENFEYNIQAPPLTTVEGLDDLYFKTLDSANTKLTFYEPNSSIELHPTSLVPGKQYLVAHTATIQNLRKTSNVPTTQVTMQLKINEQTNIRNTVSYKDLSTEVAGAEVKIEGIFTAGQKNTFVVSIDPDNVYPEQKEDNNSWQTSFEYSGAAKQCNEACNSNSDCGTDQRCYNTGSEKYCRLATNVTSTSCSPTPDQGLRRSCNEYCADTRECGAGFTCWYNKCRLLQNLESTSCRLPQLTGTTTGTGGPTKGGLSTTSTAITYQGCNERCTSNRDCSSGLRCYQGSCRNPVDVSSISCSTSGNTTAAATPKPFTTTPATSPTARPGASPRPTITPTPTPILTTTATTAATITATPYATPLAVVEPTATPQAGQPGNNSALPPAIQSVIDFFTALPQTIISLFGGIDSNSQIFGFPTPYVIICVGAIFLLIGVLLVLFTRHETTPPVPPPSPAPTTDSLTPRSISPGAPVIHYASSKQTPHHNPLPSKELLAKQPMPPLPVQPSITRPSATAPEAVRPAYKPAIQQGINTLKPPVTPPQPAPAQTPLSPSAPAATSPTELLAQDAKISMADRLKMKGVEFSKEQQQN